MIFEYLDIMRTLRRSPEDIKSLQWDRFRAIVKHAYDNVPFYRQKFDAAGMCPEDIRSREDIVRIPITTKEELRAAGKSAFAINYSSKNCIASKTSGSTGTPFTSYLDLKAWYVSKYIAKWRARTQCGVTWGSRIVNVEACSPTEAARMSRSPLRIFMGMRYLSVFDSFDAHTAFYNSFKPDYIYGLPSYFLEYGEYLDEQKDFHSSLRGLFVSGEVLTAQSRRKIEQSFNVPVFDIYGNTELKEIAWECPAHTGYHINEDLQLVEFIHTDELKEDEGEIVVTSLNSKGMPYIRYSVGDVGVRVQEQEKCSCGAPFSKMMPVRGREVDYLFTPEGNRISPYLLTTTIEQVAGVVQYQVVQRSIDCVEIFVRALPNSFELVRERLVDVLSGLLGKNVVVQVHACTTISHEKSGKYRVVKNETARSIPVHASPARARVLHLIDHIGLGGAQTIVRSLFERQRDNQHIFLYVLRQSGAREVAHAQVHIGSSWSRYSLRPLRELHALIQSEGIQILHCHLWRAQCMAILIKLFYAPDIQLVFHEHGRIFRRNPVHKLFLVASRPLVNAYIVVSDATRKKAMTLGLPSQKIHMLYNFIDYETLQAGSGRWKYKKEKYTIGFVGRLAPVKGCAILIKALPHLPFPYHCLIVGSGPEEESLRRLAARLQLTDTIEFVGVQNDIGDVYASLDVLAVPSLLEPFGLVAAEAQACGIPVVAANVPGLNEIVRDGENGLLFTRGDAHELAHALTTLWMDSNLRTQLSCKGTATSDRFSLPSYLSGLEHLYEQLTTN